MNQSLPPAKFANSVQALLSIRSRRAHLDHAISHNLAAELTSPQMAEGFRHGRWPPPGWQAQATADATERFLRLRKDIVYCALAALFVLVLAVIVAASFGRIDTALPVDQGKVVSSFGATVAAWGALLQLRTPARTYRGNFLHETTHASLVLALVVTGTALAAIVTLWWQ